MQMRYDLLICYAAIAGVTLFAAILPLPVPIHMLIITTLIVYLGCHNAVQITEQKEEDRPEMEKMERSDVYLFPIIGSCVLFGLYVLFKIFPKWLLVGLFKFYFMLAGVWVVAERINTIVVGVCSEDQENKLRDFRVDIPLMKLNDAIRPIVIKINDGIAGLKKACEPIVPMLEKLVGGINVVKYKFIALADGEGAADAARKADDAAATPATSPAATKPAENATTPQAQDWFPALIALDGVHAIAYGVAIAVALLYLITNYWLLNNVFGVCFSLQAIELLNVGSYMNGAILLCGLFFYDIFWVFGTDVMVTVAKSVDAPIKLLFPAAERHSMLGLGDIVIPGAFIALMLRYDISISKAIGHRDEKDAKLGLVNKVMNKIGGWSFIQISTDYFNTVLIGYFLGLVATLGVMYFFQAAQPALLYLVPACLIFTAGVAIVFGKDEFNSVVNYVDQPAEAQNTTTAAPEPASPVAPQTAE